FDRRGAVHEHVVGYLASLAECGLSVVLVTNSARLQPDAMRRLQTLCAGVLVRRNIGYDFGAWREAITQLRLPRPETECLVLANDSVYGPLHPLRETFEKIRLDDAAVWGLTESWQMGYHLQSYFLVFNARAVQSQAWAGFWHAVRPAPSKHWVIRRYELGLTQTMLRAGFDCQAVWPYERLVGAVDALLFTPETEGDKRDGDPLVAARVKQASRIRSSAVGRVPLNPTSDLWRQLLCNGFPFIKRELLRDNPTKVDDLSEWRGIVSATAELDLSPILLDLKRTLRNRSP
ncbi:MAG: rhamnan synthesis F family protein, partial [Candidatus Saccharimonadales bacterium]